MSSLREKDLAAALRQKEAELKQANGELEERGKLLYKTKVWGPSTSMHTRCSSHRACC